MINSLMVSELIESLKKVKPLSETQIDAARKVMELIDSEEITKEVINSMTECVNLIFAMNPGENNYNTILKRICVKNFIPAIYETYKNEPIQDKYLFMQPRKGLNQSCRYIYHKMQKEYNCTLRLHELKRGMVSTVEYYVNAMVFVKDLATAKAVFVHESNDLLGYVYLRPETKMVQLWHGCGVLKKLGFSTVGKKGFKSKAGRIEFPEYNKYSIVTIASPELEWVFEEFMGIEKKSGVIQPMGVSRTDEFFDEEYLDNCYKKLYKAIPEAKNKKLILYAPTYRGVDPNRVTPNELDIKKFADALSDDYILIFKHHQTAKNIPKIPEEYRDKFAYDMTRGRGLDINELMVVSDICITDYSSVAFEFSLFERPLLFYVFDLEEYIDDRGLYYDFNEVTPGPLCKTNEEMIDYIKHIDERFDKQEIIDFKNKFMCSCDGHATERIIEYVGVGKQNSPQRVERYKVYYSKNKAKSLEYCDEIKYSTESPCIVKANRFTLRNYSFAGWYMRKMKDDMQYWYCEDGSWRRINEFNNIPYTNRHLFKEGDSLQNVITQEAQTNLVMEAQWNPNKIASFEIACVKTCRKSYKRLKKIVKKVVKICR